MNNEQKNWDRIHQIGKKMDNMGPIERSRQTGKLLAASLLMFIPEEELTDDQKKFPAFDLHQASQSHAEA